jgi:hypothetical protein
MIKIILDKFHTDRIESLKSGLIGAVALICAVSLVNVGNGFLAASDDRLTALLLGETLLDRSIGIAIAGTSGFLFGVTYRYIVRADELNPHLKSGAVLAFGLVRGLAQIEIALKSPELLFPAGIAAIESLLLFAMTRIVLDWGLDRH